MNTSSTNQFQHTSKAAPNGWVHLGWMAITAVVMAGMAGCQSTKGVNMPARQIQSTLPSRSITPSSEQKIDVDQVARVNIELAANYYAYKQYDAAMEAVIRAIEAQPENPRALMLAGFIQLDLKDTQKGQYFVERAVASAPGDPDILHNQASYLCRSGREAQSIGIFDAALQIPTYRRPGMTQAAAGVCLMKMKRFDDAFERFNEALATEPMHPQALLGLAEIHLQRGQAAKAKEYLQRQQRVAPASPESLWLDIQTSRALGLKDDETMSTSDLRNQFPDSEQAKKLDVSK